MIKNKSFNCRYEMTQPRCFNHWNHRWIIVGNNIAAHLDIRPYQIKDGPIEYSAGLEIHYGQPPDYMADEAPHHEECWLLHGPCWHDGTSLYAQEEFVPIFLNGCDHDLIFVKMINWVKDHI